MNKMIYPTNDEIINTVTNYISESIYKYAILIDGDWGSGKTWFTKNILIPQIDEYIKSNNLNSKYKKTIYITLNGLESVNDISAKMLFCIFRNGERNVTKKFSSIANTFFKCSNFNINVTDIGILLSSFVNISEYIIIFDDLERCKCEIAETLGFINDFVEHNDAKIILVANESEIEVSNSYAEPLKYIAASQKNIAIGKQTDELLNINQLQERIDKMFKEESNYKRIKEKLIGQTIKYCPDLNEVVSVLIKNNIDQSTTLYSLLLQEKDSFIKLMQNECIHNLRTFQFFLSVITKLDKLIGNIKYEEISEYELILKIVIKYCFHVSLKYKKGDYNISWEKDEMYGHINLSAAPYMSEKIIGFAFIDYAISYNIYDKTFIATSIKSFIDYVKEQAEESHTIYSGDSDVILLSSWWEFSDKDVLSALKGVHDKVKKNYFKPKHYINLIKTALPPLIECNLDRSNFDNMYSYMQSRIRDEDVEYSWRDFTYLNQSQNVTTEYNKKINEIKDILNAKKKGNDYDTIADFLKKETWGELFYNDLFERERNPNITTEEKSLISKLDIDKVCKLIKCAPSKQICSFRYYIASLYDFSNICEYYKKDIKNLEAMLLFIQKMDKTKFDNIKQMNIKLLEKLLKEKIELLKL